MEGERVATHTEIKSMSHAAYLMMKGLRLVSGQRNPANRKEFVFLFEDPDGKAEPLVMEFLSSECRDFDHAVRDLRAIVNAKSV